MRILKFYSDTCGPCKVLDSNLKKVGIEYESVDVYDSNNDSLIEKYGIKTLPTLIKEENGKEIARHTGVMTEIQIKEWCNE